MINSIKWLVPIKDDIISFGQKTALTCLGVFGTIMYSIYILKTLTGNIEWNPHITKMITSSKTAG